ncbi:MAG: YegS/Rv2252/BmrU family lipid kinase [Clostridia bacterium]|nr:YegS/Rv2252/BmrU family lipid kinase [Clostridia bacterium]
MKHIFILNPAAGKHRAALEVQPKAEAFFESHPMEHAFFITSHPGEATEIARRECARGETRVYACGGDGTVLEVLNGIGEHSHAELACVPCGSGNDFLRFLPNEELFHDPAALICGEARPVDIIRCDDHLSLNMCSMGMDANVADRMVRYKHLPLVSGSMAYNLAVARTFFGKLGQKLHIIMETEQGHVEREGNYLFALAANGQYYGGGYHGSPLSQPDDGVLDFILIKDLNHFNVLRFLGMYKNGKHLDLPCCEMFRGTQMRVQAETPAVVTADGECFSTTDVSFSLLPGAVSFVYPTEMLKNCEKSEFSQIGT